MRVDGPDRFLQGRCCLNAALQYGEIIRLSLPDDRPNSEHSTLRMHCQCRLEGTRTESLEHVQFFGRYDFRESTRCICLGRCALTWEPIKLPVTFTSASESISLSALRRTRRMGDAQVFRQHADSTLKIFNVRLSSALDGS